MNQFFIPKQVIACWSKHTALVKAVLSGPLADSDISKNRITRGYKFVMTSPLFSKDFFIDFVPEGSDGKWNAKNRLNKENNSGKFPFTAQNQHEGKQ